MQNEVSRSSCACWDKALDKYGTCEASDCSWARGWMRGGDRGGGKPRVGHGGVNAEATKSLSPSSSCLGLSRTIATTKINTIALEIHHCPYFGIRSIC